MTPYDRHTGACVVGSTPVHVLTFVDLVSESEVFGLWVCNDSDTLDVNVLFMASPDGLCVDIQTLEPRVAPPGKATHLNRGTDETRRYWAICCYTDSGTAPVRWGVTQVLR